MHMGSSQIHWSEFKIEQLTPDCHKNVIVAAALKEIDLRVTASGRSEPHCEATGSVQKTNCLQNLWWNWLGATDIVLTFHAQLCRGCIFFSALTSQLHSRYLFGGAKFGQWSSCWSWAMIEIRTLVPITLSLRTGNMANSWRTLWMIRQAKPILDSQGLDKSYVLDDALSFNWRWIQLVQWVTFLNI